MLNENDVSAISSLGPAMDSAALAGDWLGLTGLFTEDCVIMPPDGPEIQGRKAFFDFIESMDLKVQAHKLEFHDVGGDGDSAYGRARYAETFTATGLEGPVEDEGKVLCAVRMQPDGSWKFSRWMWSSDLPNP